MRAFFVAAAARPSVSRHAGVHPTRRARRAPLRRKGSARHMMAYAGLLVAAAARPSVSRHAGVHPTDALGARRYEEGDCRKARFHCVSSRRRPGSSGGNVGASDRRAWLACASLCATGIAAIERAASISLRWGRRRRGGLLLPRRLRSLRRGRACWDRCHRRCLRGGGNCVELRWLRGR